MPATINADFVKQCAAEVGFHACGIAPAAKIPDFDAALNTWLHHDYNASMDYMTRNTDKRVDPSILLPQAKSVISLLLSYNPSQTMKGRARIARYAYGEDYHTRIKRMLFELIARLSDHYPDFSGRPFVDTAPISDKRWANAAGLGWIGKNTLLVNELWGSFCNIGEIVTTSIADHYDSPLQNRCGSCTRCLDACPNKALLLQDGMFMLDARRCTAFNTIENKDSHLPANQKLGGFAFGCDICQEVCPYNTNAQAAIDVSDDRIANLQNLAQANEQEFAEITTHSALSRITYTQWQRNLTHTTPEKKE